MPACWLLVSPFSVPLVSDTHCYSTIELAMEPHARAKDDGRGGHDVDAFGCGRGLELEVLAGGGVCAARLYACCAELYSAWVVVESVSGIIVLV